MKVSGRHQHKGMNYRVKQLMVGHGDSGSTPYLLIDRGNASDEPPVRLRMTSRLFQSKDASHDRFHSLGVAGTWVQRAVSPNLGEAAGIS